MGILLPELGGYYIEKGTYMRAQYIKWIEENKFLTEEFALSFIDVALIIKSVEKKWNRAFTHDEKDEMVEIFYKNFTVENDWGYNIRPEANKIGMKAIEQILNAHDWAEINCSAKIYELFLKYIERSFLNYRYLKEYIASIPIRPPVKIEI